MLINTGDLVRRLRSETVGAVESAVWNAAGKAWKPVTSIASAALTVAAAVPAPLITAPNVLGRAVLGHDTLPLWSKDLPQGGARRTPGGADATADAVYFQACVGTMFGPAEGGEGVAVAFESLAAKAGMRLARPDGVGGLCCGTPWKSKGILDGYHDMVERTARALWDASDGGRLPVVCDNSSCSEGLVLALEKAVAEHPEFHAMRILDAVDFTAEHILPKLDLEPTVARMAVHPTCSSTRAGSNVNLAKLAARGRR